MSTKIKIIIIVVSIIAVIGVIALSAFIGLKTTEEIGTADSSSNLSSELKGETPVTDQNTASEDTKPGIAGINVGTDSSATTNNDSNTNNTSTESSKEATDDVPKVVDSATVDIIPNPLGGIGTPIDIQGTYSYMTYGNNQGKHLVKFPAEGFDNGYIMEFTKEGSKERLFDDNTSVHVVGTLGVTGDGAKIPSITVVNITKN